MTNPACKNCDRKDHCKMYADARAFYADAAEFGCKHFKPKQTKTNGDSIRAMSDAELAKEILQLMIFIVDTIVSVTGLDIEVVFKDDCVQFWLDWLKEEVKE